MKVIRDYVFGSVFFQALSRILRTLRGKLFSFHGSEEYWRRRYERGGNSGDGSYSRLADFKAEVINSFLSEHSIKSVIEFGCGDGNQLSLGQYPEYIGLDVSPDAVSMCRARFVDDPTKNFMLVADYNGEHAELALSLDVIYHLVEDDVFEKYMRTLFDAADKFVVIYSSNDDRFDLLQAPHVRHRTFSRWVEEKRPDWQLLSHIPNRFPYEGSTKTGSIADFYIYCKP